MKISREGEIITIKMSSADSAEELQRTLDYARVLEITSAMKKMPQEEVDSFSDEVKREWWEENKNRFV